MAEKDPRIDAYIARARPFAQPILTHLRAVVHAACPDVKETMKWSRPHFDYHGIMCGMSAFTAHCAFGFWLGRHVVGDDVAGSGAGGMGQFGRLTTVADLPSEATLKRYIRKAMALNESRASGSTDAAAPVRRPVASKKTAKPLPPVPTDLRAALAANPRAAEHFKALPPSHKREYLEWVTGAKGADTRARRVATTVEWNAEGKSRNWKYETRRA
jgi:hypothetical protein